MNKSSMKRRRTAAGAAQSRKKLKTTLSGVGLDELPWSISHRPREAGADGGDGILELEEVDNVEVVYEETGAGKVARFNVLSDAQLPMQPQAQQTKNPATEEMDSTEEAPESTFDSQNLLPDWHPYTLHPNLLESLHHQGFKTPTPIQSRALPAAREGKDIVGIAETGSGKTLAYGLPILHHLLSHARRQSSLDSSRNQKRQLKALVLAPTRELALQVSSHLNACLDSSSWGEAPSSKRKGKKTAVEEQAPAQNTAVPRAPPLVSVAAIVGGMSVQKQKRILDRGVDVLVATPGRLWDIIEENDKLAAQIKQLRFLVLDEADRMIEAGHFEELDGILRLTLRSHQAEVDEEFEIDLPSGPDLDRDRLDEADDTVEETHDNPPDNDDDALVDADDMPNDRTERDTLQTFVFSATMSKDLQRNLKRRQRLAVKQRGKKDKKPISTLDDLLLRLDFRDTEPEVIDLSPEGGAVSTLRQCKIECLSGDKDVYLYYFLLRYPGRSLVFLSSIDGIRRLLPLLELLELKVYPLHSQLEQRQRLKNLDRFRSTPHSVLLATDIAARGLDIPDVDHVVHYQVPRTADVYVHRNGRTARAQRQGFSLLMCAPDERRIVRPLLSSIGREENEVPEISVELHLLDKLKARAQLARQIDQQRHKVKKENHEKKWVHEAAEALGVDVDDDVLRDEESISQQKRKKQDAKTAKIRFELREMLVQPLLAQGVSVRYITSGARPIAEDLANGDVHETMLGLPKSIAGSEVVSTKKKRKTQQSKQERVDPEQWTGIGDEAAV